MQKLQKEIEDFIEKSTDPDFEILSKKWANYCLENFDNEMLRKGLDLSIALRRFDDEWKGNVR